MRRMLIVCAAILVGVLASGCARGLVSTPSPDADASAAATTATRPEATATPRSAATPAAGLAGLVAYAAGADPQVFFLDLATGEARQMTELTPAHAELTSQGPLSPVVTCGFGVHTLDWSPDGSRLAFTYGGCESVIYLLDLDGSLTRVGEGNGPTWSPDGRRIVFRPNMPYCPAPEECRNPPHPGAWNLQVVDIASGTRPHALTIDEATSGAGQPHFSIDGTLIAFTGPIPEPAENPDVFSATYVSKADGSDAVLVARGAWPASWLPDGRLVIVDELTGEIRAVDLETAGAESLGGSMGPALVAPDGSRLIGTSFDDVTGAMQVELTTVRGDLLAAFPGWAAAWSSDSRAAVVVDTEGVGGLIVIDRDGAVLGEFPIRNAPLGVIAVAWRPGT